MFFYPSLVGRETDDFLNFVEFARALKVRPEIEIAEVPAPQRLAPHAVALSVDIANSDGEDDLATGRFVMLHDPAGQDSWEGNFRCVTFIRSALEDELENEPMLADVAWSWVSEALDRAGADYGSSGGTITRASSKSFGSIAGSEDSSEIEIRASWSPTNSTGLAAHLNGWIYLVELAAGLTPIEEGVSALKKRR